MLSLHVQGLNYKDMETRVRIMTLILKITPLTFLKFFFFYFTLLFFFFFLPQEKNSEHIDKPLKSWDSKVNEAFIYISLYKVVLDSCDILISSFIFGLPEWTF